MRALICSLRPYLRAKGEQADIILEMQTLKDNQSNRPLTEDEYQVYTNLCQQLHALNRKGS